MTASQPTAATIRHQIEEAREIRAAELLRRLQPSTRTHRPADPVMSHAEIMLAWDRYTRRIAELASVGEPG